MTYFSGAWWYRPVSTWEAEARRLLGYTVVLVKPRLYSGILSKRGGGGWKCFFWVSSMKSWVTEIKGAFLFVCF